MAKQIKFNIIQFLFRLFSFLADKTNGWAMFVKPKLLIGSLIIGGFGVSSCTPEVTCYLPPPSPEVTCYDMPEFPPPEDPMCYVSVPSDCKKSIDSISHNQNVIPKSSNEIPL